MTPSKSFFNDKIEKINKELKRVYGISNVNVIRTVLKESGAFELAEQNEKLLEALKECRMAIYSTEYNRAIRHYGGEGSKGASKISERAALTRVKSIDEAIQSTTNK